MLDVDIWLSWTEENIKVNCSRGPGWLVNWKRREASMPSTSPSSVLDNENNSTSVRMCFYHLKTNSALIENLLMQNYSHLNYLYSLFLKYCKTSIRSFLFRSCWESLVSSQVRRLDRWETFPFSVAFSTSSICSRGLWRRFPCGRKFSTIYSISTPAFVL